MIADVIQGRGYGGIYRKMPDDLCKVAGIVNSWEYTILACAAHGSSRIRGHLLNELVTIGNGTFNSNDLSFWFDLIYLAKKSVANNQNLPKKAMQVSLYEKTNLELLTIFLKDILLCQKLIV